MIDTEAVLRERLKQRAARIDVVPDLYGGADLDLDLDLDLASAGPGVGRQAPRGRVPQRLAVAAVALVAVALGAWALTGRAEPRQIGVAAAPPAGSDVVAPPGVDTEVIIWLDEGVDASTVQELQTWLDTNELVVASSYFGEAETYREFQDYYADEPEVLALVAPGQLPTSIRVDSFDGQLLAEQVRLLKGVRYVETVRERTVAPDAANPNPGSSDTSLAVGGEEE